MARKLTLEFLKTEAGSGAVLGFAALSILVAFAAFAVVFGVEIGEVFQWEG